MTECPADKQLSAGMSSQREAPLSLLQKVQALGVEEAGNYLSASSVPHNWLSFASSLLGWECTKSLEGGHRAIINDFQK